MNPSVQHLFFRIKSNIEKAERLKLKYISVYATKEEWELLFRYIEKIKKR